jgi:hypothetical protein
MKKKTFVESKMQAIREREGYTYTERKRDSKRGQHTNHALLGPKNEPRKPDLLGDWFCTSAPLGTPMIALLLMVLKSSCAPTLKVSIFQMRWQM